MLAETSSTTIPTVSAGRNRRPGAAGEARNAATMQATSPEASRSRTCRERRHAPAKCCRSARGIARSARTVRPQRLRERGESVRRRIPFRPREKTRTLREVGSTRAREFLGEPLECLALFVDLAVRGCMLGEAKCALDWRKAWQPSQTEELRVVGRDRGDENCGSEEEQHGD